ncbi:LpxA family transferase [Methylobacterium sp. Leaf99]|uniref:LpxA family transferase n=1 Tax=Methylobacterium sp. Leaf99 TaxID=1736251 RepID=UPI0007009386|nr:LpxA family transferase [Methylobacterium sp. Leaf99]KQP06067.1 LpxA family transferase [Methylobacterium sp. Leaf99]
MTIVDAHIASWRSSPLAAWATGEPWDIVTGLAGLVARLLETLGTDYEIEGDIAVHRTTRVEAGAVMKGPLIVGPNCLVAMGSLIRGGCWLDSDCIVGPGAELKTTIMFQGSKLAHFNFVGDSILGSDVNLEAGSILANYRNEHADPRLQISYDGKMMEADTLKFGALVGDGCRIGANAVVAPGAILAPGTVVSRLGLIDQRPSS